MRMVEDLPQPEGPRTDRKEPSGHSMLRSFTAETLPYFFQTLRNETFAIVSSCYSLTAPMVRPVTRYFLMMRPRNIMGSAVTVPAAMI